MAIVFPGESGPSIKPDLENYSDFGTTAVGEVAKYGGLAESDGSRAVYVSGGNIYLASSDPKIYFDGAKTAILELDPTAGAGLNLESYDNAVSINAANDARIYAAVDVSITSEAGNVDINATAGDVNISAGSDDSGYDAYIAGHKIYFTGHDNNEYFFWNGSAYTRLDMTADKAAIMPLGGEYRTLYCMESPEVWFMDFVGEDKKLDPLFEEATEGDAKFIATDDGGYQVWRRRRGKSQQRFDIKSKEQFENNNKFWGQAYNTGSANKNP